MCDEFNNYLCKFNHYDKFLVYRFNKMSGGLGDLTKFFMYLLNICIKQNIRLYYLNTNNDINKYFKIIDKFSIEPQELVNTLYISNEYEIYNLAPNVYYIIEPYTLYAKFSYELLTINFNNVFYFDNEIIINSKNFVNIDNFNYISIHLRLGDEYLETDKQFIICNGDKREFNENNIFEFILNSNDNIIFFCDNSQYKNKIKILFNKIIITDFNIGHTGLKNTNEQQITLHEQQQQQQQQRP